MRGLLPSIKYAGVTLRHKWFVFRAGLHTGAPLWNLLVHDLSKFGPHELFPYGNRFFGDGSDREGFSRAWIHHQNVNPHHWEYWIPRTTHDRGGYPPNEPVQIPDEYLREMAADWLGASRAYDGKWPTSLETWSWFQSNFETRIRLHSESRLKLGVILVDALKKINRRIK